MRVRDRLLQKFNDFKYRHAYVDDFTDAFIATQIKVLREQQGLTQTQLADKAGMKQSQISELEDVNHQGWKVRTLKKLAKAFDLALVVRFEPFGRVLDDIVGFDRQHLQRDTFMMTLSFAKTLKLLPAPLKRSILSMFTTSSRGIRADSY